MTDQMKTIVTEEDLAKYDAQDIWVEVIDGEIVEVDREAVTFFHVIIIDNLFRIIDVFLQRNKLGRVHTDGVRFMIQREGETIRRAHVPDLFYLRKGRIPTDYNWQVSFPGAPDFAVEVISPGQGTGKLLAKIAAYLQAGTEEAWLIFPSKREVHQYRHDEQVPQVYKEADAINMNLLFPGLIIQVRDIFTTES